MSGEDVCAELKVLLEAFDVDVLAGVLSEASISSATSRYKLTVYLWLGRDPSSV